MQCPFCQTENREDRETCYVCGKDISTIRLLANKARQHYNDALEHAERDRVPEAIAELRNALDLDSSLVNAHVVLGTLYARQGDFARARACWQDALQLNPEMARAHDYLERVESVQVALPTIKTYRRVALLLLTSLVVVAAALIIKLRPESGLKELHAANTLIASGKSGEARGHIDQARTLAVPGSSVATAANSLSHIVNLDIQQRIRFIQDMKYRQLYREALHAMNELQAIGLDEKTSASLQTIRDDISYYYRSMLGQLYLAYERGDVNYEQLQEEITGFISMYPPSPERDEVQSYLEHAENTEIQIAMDELKRRFSLDNNLELALDGLRETSHRFKNSIPFDAARSAFVEEMLSTQFNVFTGYLDQEDFVRARELLAAIDNASRRVEEDAAEDQQQFITADISGAVDLAWSLLRDAQRQYLFEQVEILISEGNVDAARTALWEAMNEPDLSTVEVGLLRSYWRTLSQRMRTNRLLSNPQEVRKAFRMDMSDRQASSTLRLYHELGADDLPLNQKLVFTGMAAAAAASLGINDEATSLSRLLGEMDGKSTVTARVRQIIDNLPPPQIKPSADNPATTGTATQDNETTNPANRKDNTE